MLADFLLPRTLFARNAIDALPEELAVLGVRRPLLVSDQGVAKAGLVAKVIDALGDAVSPVIFDDVTENPIFSDADDGAALYATETCDAVIGLGGGSVIDTAKCIALLVANPGSIADYATNPDATIEGAAPVIAIPTTAGTGSEADMHAGIHPDSESESVGVMSQFLVPRLAILDPELTVSLPPHLTAATGIDAMSHCIETFLSKNDAPLLKAIALDGLKRGMAAIRRAVADGNDIEARGEMMISAYAGGLAMCLGCGPAHAVALTCSDQGFQHGILSGIGLVAALDDMAALQPARGAALREAMDLPPSASLGGAIADLMRELGLPATLGELGYEVSDLTSVAAASHESFCNLSAFYHPSTDEYAAMLSTSLNQKAA